MSQTPKYPAPDEEPLESFAPRGDLRDRALLPGNGRAAARKAIASAEEAMEELSVHFGSWMDDEVKRLIGAREALIQQSAEDRDLEPVFTAAHDIKGQAGTFGYPYIGQVCASLCRLIDSVAKNQVPDILLDQHVNAVRAMAREDARGDDNATASALAEKLADVTEHFIRSQAAPKADSEG